MRRGFVIIVIDESSIWEYLKEREQMEEQRRREQEEFLQAMRRIQEIAEQEYEQPQIEDRNAEWDDFKSIRTVGFLRSPLRIGPHLIPWYTSGFQ